MRDVGPESLQQLLPVLLLGVGMIASYAWKERLATKRADRIRELTGDKDIAWYGDSLPPDLPQALLDSLPASLEITNSVSGFRHGERVVAFDYAIGWGRQKVFVTAVAVQRVHPECPLGHLRTRKISRFGNWVLTRSPIFLFAGRRSVDRIVEEWDQLRSTTDKAGQQRHVALKSEDNLFIPPRHAHRQ